jgi:hypothetical protein
MRCFVTSINYIEGFEFTKTVVNGTYRCSIEIAVEEIGGSADVVTDQIIAKN